MCTLFPPKLFSYILRPVRSPELEIHLTVVWASAKAKPFTSNDSQLRGHWEEHNSICRPSNLITDAESFIFSKIRHGQNERWPKDELSASREASKTNKQEIYLCMDATCMRKWEPEWIVTATMLCLQSVTLFFSL